MAESASTWIQVAFGGLGVAVAIVAAVIAYFAWIQPHSPAAESADETGPADRPAATVQNGTGDQNGTGKAAEVPLTDLEPVLGGGTVRRAGRDLTMPCATGQTSDRQRTVEYDLLGRYATAEATVTVSKARDDETPLQVKVLADGLVATTATVTKAAPGRLSVPLDGKQRMRIQLVCQFPDGEITIGNPTLKHL